eukprot:gene9031-6332_t
MKPFLVFGLRGTLVERLHVRNMPQGMPDPHLTVGLTRVWLRHDVLPTLLALQSKCHLAIWSSTTARNTKALTEAVFDNEAVWKKALPDRFGAGAASAAAAEANAAPAEQQNGGVRGGRFSRRKPGEGADAAVSAVAFTCPVKFEFTWTREHTIPDEFRRSNAIIREDSHATVKDLSRVYAAYPGIATPQNTVLIDDTPSKAKHNAANFLWMDSCQDLGISDQLGMKRLLEFVDTELLSAKDVREVLPRRIRSEQASKGSSIRVQEISSVALLRFPLGFAYVMIYTSHVVSRTALKTIPLLDSAAEQPHNFIVPSYRIHTRRSALIEVEAAACPHCSQLDPGVCTPLRSLSHIHLTCLHHLHSIERSTSTGTVSNTYQVRDTEQRGDQQQAFSFCLHLPALFRYPNAPNLKRTKEKKIDIQHKLFLVVAVFHSSTRSFLKIGF